MEIVEKSEKGDCENCLPKVDGRMGRGVSVEEVFDPGKPTQTCFSHSNEGLLSGTG